MGFPKAPGVQVFHLKRWKDGEIWSLSLRETYKVGQSLINNKPFQAKL